MEENELEESERSFLELQEIFSPLMTADFLFKNRIGIVIILDYYKARDWPWKGRPFTNEHVKEIPLVWAIFDAPDSCSIRMSWETHPMKCFPIHYNQYNPNAKIHHMPIVKGNIGTLGGALERLRPSQIVDTK